jgi:hypothetical protein
MKAVPQAWFACSAEGATNLRCAVCGTDIDPESAAADHHPRVCPACGVDCVFIDWKGRVVQVVTDRAPRALAEAVRWAQRQFDELEYVEFLCALEEIAGALHGIQLHAAKHPLQPTGPAEQSEP